MYFLRGKMSDQSKRKHKTLTLIEKGEILKKIDKGEKIVRLAKHYGIGRATVHDIRKNRREIEDFIKKAEGKLKTRQTIRHGEYPRMEEALYTWFLQERQRHTPISGDILQEKAKFFYEKIYHNDNFQASDGWLGKFKARHGIRLLSITGEKLSSDANAVEPFIRRFEQHVTDLNLTPDQVYNADESGLFWKLLPNKTFVQPGEKSAPGRKVCKDRITFMPCANASGTHKLDLLVVGKSKKPRAFKNVALPVVYRNQTKAWVTRELFKTWFDEDFVPAVRKFLKRRNLPLKALLVLDNAPGHPREDELKSRDGNITVMFLPPNVTPLLQPMDQNVIQSIKSRYKKQLLMQVIRQEDINITDCLKATNLKDVVFMLAQAWKSTATNVILTSWNKLWPSRRHIDIEENEWEEEDNIPLSELLEALSEQGLEFVNAQEWLEGQNEDVFLDDQDILDSLEEIEVDSVLLETSNSSTNLDQVYASFEVCVKWAEESAVSAENILVLRQLRENVFRQSFLIKKQKKITDYFSQ